ncbi:MAG: hypothetical protein U0353_17610 [Sandaracinus sp.]
MKVVSVSHTAAATLDAEGKTALASLEERLRAMPSDGLEVVNLDINAAVVTAMGCLPELAPYRAEIARIDAHTAAALDELPSIAWALNQAHARYLVNDTTSADLAELSKRVVDARGLLLAEASVLVQRKQVDADKLAQLKGAVGFRNQVSDVLQLVEVLRGAGGSRVTTEELEQAEAAAQALVLALGKREQAPQGQSEASELRQRCFTLFVRSYDELRRVMSYLRWHEGDVDAIIPSLYAGRSRPRSKDETSPTSTPVIVAPIESEPAKPVREPAKPEPAKPEIGPDASNPEGKPPARPGMPDSNPFAA